MIEALGYIKLFRRSVGSQVFQNEGLWKVWCWCLLRANHRETWVSVVTGRGTTEIKIEAGQFIFGRESAAREMRMKPSTIRDRMKKLERMQNIVIQSNSHYSVISIVNWDRYQTGEMNFDSQADRQPTGNQQPSDTDKNDKNEKKKTPGKISGPAPSLEDYRRRYTDQLLLDEAFEAIASTRKTGKVAESVLLTQLEAWERFPVEQVKAGLKIYLGKGYARLGKNEKYLFGIIRNGNKVKTLEPPAGKDWYEEVNAI